MGQGKTREPQRTAASFVWDTEERHELLEREGRVRDNTMNLTVGLAQWMETVFGGVLSYVKTSTDVVSGEVTIARALAGEPGAVKVQRVGAQNALFFNFWRPLRKLSLRVPAGRQFNVTPFTREMESIGTVFVFPMHERRSVPRGAHSEGEAEAAAVQVTFA